MRLFKHSARQISASILAFTLLTVGGCLKPAAQPHTSRSTCEASHRSSAQRFDPARALVLAGEYQLTLVSQWLEEAGRATTGRLLLWPADTLRRYYTPQFLTIYDTVRSASGTLQLRGIRIVHDSIVRWDRSGDNGPLLGALEIDLQPVSAPALDFLASRDSNQPGARLVGSEIHLTPPPLGVLQFDGSSTRLRIEAVDARGFYGRWTTDFGIGRIVRDGRTVTNPAGFFCARRIETMSAPIANPPQN